MYSDGKVCSAIVFRACFTNQSEQRFILSNPMISISIGWRLDMSIVKSVFYFTIVKQSRLKQIDKVSYQKSSPMRKFQQESQKSLLSDYSNSELFLFGLYMYIFHILSKSTNYAYTYNHMQRANGKCALQTRTCWKESCWLVSKENPEIYWKNTEAESIGSQSECNQCQLVFSKRHNNSHQNGTIWIRYDGRFRGRSIFRVKSIDTL